MNFMNRLARFMYGRYGSDQLSVALLVFSLLLSFALNFVPVPVIRLIAYIPMILCIYRMLSRNTAKRWQENMQFLKLWNPVSSWFKLRIRILKESKTHKYFKCTHCGQKLRAPRHRGKILVTCQRCKTEFLKKT